MDVRGWRTLCNEKPNVTKVVISKRIKWSGHLTYLRDADEYKIQAAVTVGAYYDVSSAGHLCLWLCYRRRPCRTLYSLGIGLDHNTFGKGD